MWSTSASQSCNGGCINGPSPPGPFTTNTQRYGTFIQMSYRFNGHHSSACVRGRRRVRSGQMLKAELREMLTEAVRNTQSELKRRPKAKKDRDQAARMKGTCEVPKMPFLEASAPAQ